MLGPGRHLPDLPFPPGTQAWTALAERLVNRRIILKQPAAAQLLD